MRASKARRRPLHHTASLGMPAIPVLPGNRRRAWGRGVGLLGCVLLREAPGGGVPDPASPLSAAAARTPPPDGSRRFAIAPPAGQGRARAQARGGHLRRAPGSRAVSSRRPSGLRGPRPLAQELAPTPCPVPGQPSPTVQARSCWLAWSKLGKPDEQATPTRRAPGRAVDRRLEDRPGLPPPLGRPVHTACSAAARTLWEGSCHSV